MLVWFTTRNYGFSDGADLFVFISGYKGLFGQQCADCHKTETWKVAGFLHPSPKSQECNQCHQAPPSHYMMHFETMDKGITGQKNAGVEQCFLCHQTDAFNDIRRRMVQDALTMRHSSARRKHSMGRRTRL